MSSAPLVYDLTPMTRKADSGRRIVIWGFDMQKRALLLGAIGFVPGVIFTAITYPFLGVWSLSFILLFIIAVFWAIEGRSSRGLKMHNWQTQLDKRKSKNGKFFVCGHEIELLTAEVCYIRSYTLPVERVNETTVDDLFEVSF